MTTYIANLMLEGSYQVPIQANSVDEARAEAGDLLVSPDRVGDWDISVYMEVEG